MLLCALRLMFWLCKCVIDSQATCAGVQLVLTSCNQLTGHCCSSGVGLGPCDVTCLRLLVQLGPCHRSHPTATLCRPKNRVAACLPCACVAGSSC
jgi:hypothetical protein